MLAVLAADGLCFPLELRGWAPGDRIRTAGGTRKVKKLLGERRVPRAARARVPVLADAQGTLLWLGGVALAAGRAPRPGAPALLLRITRTGDG
jgi:tRNA(Ile)-lysidine synthetase-like protein